MTVLLAIVLIAAVQKRLGPSAKPLPGAALKTRAGARYVGTAVDATALSREPGYRKDLGAQFSSVTPENAMKWAVIEPAQGSYSWSQADALVKFAASHGQRVRGHTLLWYNQTPGWAAGLAAGPLRAAIKARIDAELTRYRGKIADWDVVNEAVSDDGGLRSWFVEQKLGPGYIADAFRWAHAADPSARLWINEIGGEAISPKSDRLYALVKSLRADGVPIDGVGFQGHFSLQGVPPTFRANLARFAKLGVKVALTELDVAVPLPATDDKLERQAAIYRDAARACVEQPACVGMTVWGFTDRHSWIPGAEPGMGAATLLDGDLKAKPAYAAFGGALGS